VLQEESTNLCKEMQRAKAFGQLLVKYLQYRIGRAMVTSSKVVRSMSNAKLADCKMNQAFDHFSYFPELDQALLAKRQ